MSPRAQQSPQAAEVATRARGAAERLRRTWLKAHRWMGLLLAAALLPLCLSGATLVWRPELERWLEPQRFVSEDASMKLPASAYMAAGARALGPDLEVSQLLFPEAAGEPVIAAARTATGLRAVWMHPVDASVLDVGDPQASLLGRLHSLHGSLMIPEIGRKVVGWLGWGLLVSAVTGLWLWWPRRSGLGAALGWRRTGSGLLNLHYATGFWLCLPLAMLALTGALVSFPGLVPKLFGPPASTRTAGVAPPAPGVDEMIRLARQFAPGAEPRRVMLPPDRDGRWRVALEAPSQIVEAPLSGGKLEVKPGRHPASMALRQAHDGVGMSGLWRGLIFLGGLAPVALAVSGVIIWLRRRLRAGQVARA